MEKEKSSKSWYHEYDNVVCPYCKAEQNPFNIPLSPSTTGWILHDCDSCGETFAYVQVVERSYCMTKVERK